MSVIVDLSKSLARRMRAYLRCKVTKNVILVLGDSHVSVFKDSYLTSNFPDAYFAVCLVGGGTISGLKNPNSKTNCRSIFKEYLNNYRCAKKIILMLGEVDTGFVIWYRAIKYNESVNEMLNKTVLEYEYFIEEVKEYGEVLVISTPLPTIRDGDSGDVANQRKEVVASLSERTELTIKFNALIQSFCERCGVSYLGLDEDSLGQDGLVAAELRNQDPMNHHYDQLKYAKLLTPKLRTILQPEL